MKQFFRWITLSGLLILTTTTYSQACKKYLMKEATDEFTGQAAVFTNKVVYSQPTLEQSRSISFRVLDENRVFLHLTSGISQDLVFGSEVVLTFVSGEELTLQIEQIHREKEGSVHVTHANCRIYYKQDVERFYNDKITQINLLGSRQVFEIDKADQTNILAGALCMTETVGLDNMNFSSERNTTLMPDPSAVSFSGGSSFVSVGGSVKCEFEMDTLLAGDNIVKVSKPKELASSPYKLHAQVSLNNQKVKLLLTYGIDLGNLNATSYAIFKFTDGSFLNLKHAGTAVNSKQPVFEADITLYQDDFMKKDLAAVRISYSEYYADLYVAHKNFIADYLRYCMQ